MREFARPEAQQPGSKLKAQSSRLKIILESLNLRIPQNVEGTESARAKGKEKTESERREREVVRARGWREE